MKAKSSKPMRDAPNRTVSKTDNGHANRMASATIGLLAILALFWLAIGVWQLAAAIMNASNSSTPDAGVFLVGIWNIAIAAFHLLAIRGIQKRSKTTLRNLATLSVLSAVWGIMALSSGGIFQFVAVLLYVLLGALLFLNRPYYTTDSPQELERARATPIGKKNPK